MSISDLTKGGQSAKQNFRMTFNIILIMLSVAFASWCISFAGLLYIKTTPYERYKALLIVETAPFSFLFDNIEKQLSGLGLSSRSNPENDAKVTFKTEEGVTLKLTDDEVLQRIATPSFLDYVKNLFLWNAIEALLLSLIVVVLLYKALITYGKKLSKKSVLRGTRVCEADELKTAIRKDAKIEHNNKLSCLSIAGIPLPYRAELQHIWINGTPGTGKTIALSDLMTQVRKTKHRAIVYDSMGDLVARFYRPGKDIILNPFDERSPVWNIWAECENSVDYEMIAAAQIGMSPGEAEPFWKTAARSLYSATARRLKTIGKANTRTLLRYLLTSDLDKLRELLKDTEAESLVSKDLEKTALSVKAVLNDYIKSMRFLKDEGEPFSIRKWVKNDNEDSWLFITSRAEYHETLMPLISAWYDIAINTALSLPKNPDRRIFNFIDELPSLQYLPSLQKGMAGSRQKGLSFIFGTQDIPQLRVIYGADNAKSITAKASTKLILRTEDDAEDVARLFNQSEVEEKGETISYGVTDNRDGISINKHRSMQNMILASEIQTLKDLHGYLKVPGGHPVGKIKLTYVDYDEPNPALVERKIDVDSLLDDSNNNATDMFAEGEPKEKNLRTKIERKKHSRSIKKQSKTIAASDNPMWQELENSASTPLEEKEYSSDF